MPFSTFHTLTISSLLTAIAAALMQSTQAWGNTLDSDLNKWNETATWSQFNSTLKLIWTSEGGDRFDANGDERSRAPLNILSLAKAVLTRGLQILRYGEKAM